MGRYRYRRHYNELRRVTLDDLPKNRLGPADRWKSELQWRDGTSIGVEKAEETALRFAYRAGEREVAYHVPLAFDPRNYGGVQAYLTCPRCGRRCRVFRFVGAELRCGRCIRAIYRSQSLDPTGRALRRFRKLRARIRPGTEDAGLYYFPRRPKGMRCITYARIKSEAMAALNRYNASLDAGLYRFLARIAPTGIELARLLE